MSENYMHKWMYSFLPAGENNDLYLVGFCPECRKAVSVIINATFYPVGKATLTETDLPRFGCVEPLLKTVKVDGLPVGR